MRQYRQVASLPSQGPSAEGKQTPANPHARGCAILSGKASNRNYLGEVPGLEASDNERVNTRVRTILNIQSRSELDTDPDSRERWFSLVGNFEGWERRRR